MTILKAEPDAVSVMYDPGLLQLAQDCVNTAMSALEARETVTATTKEAVDSETVTWLRNFLLNIAKRVSEHAAGCIDFYELRPPRGESTDLTKQLDRIILNTLSNVDKGVFRGLLMLLNAYEAKYIGPPGSQTAGTRSRLIACAVIDSAVSNPGKAVQVPSFEHGHVDMKSCVTDMVRTLVASAPKYRPWFRLEKCALVRPYGKDSFDEYPLYALTFQEPAEGQKPNYDEDGEEE